VQALLAMVPVAEAEKALGGEAQRLRAIGQALAKAGPGALVIASGSGPDGDLAHALALLATHLAGATGRTILYPNPPRPPRGDSIAAVSSLLQDAASGAVEVLLIHEANPAYQLPSLAPLLEKARFVACFTTMPDETAAACADLVIPIDHPLETWGDHVSGAGVIGLLQPAMQPMFGTRAFADVLLEMAAGLPQQGEKQKDSGPPKGGTPNEELAKGGTPNEEPTTGGIPNEGPPKGGTPNKEPPNEEPPKGGTPNEGTAQPPAARQAAWPNARAYYESRLAAYHKTLGGAAAFADFEREAKRTGILKAEKIDATPVKVASGARLPAWQAPQQGVLSWLFPHPFLFDGRHANKPWLQEIPESTTTIVWDSWAEVHPVTAKEIGVEPGGSIVLGSGKSAIATPVYITTQVAPGVVAIPIGQGHEQYGRYATGRGVNPLRLIDATRAPGGLPLSGLPLKASAGPRPVSPLVRTSGGMDQGERNLARAVPLTETQRPETQRPDREGGALESEHGRDRPFVKDPPSLYPDHQHPVYDWSMVIDLDACIGCGACVVACHAENNVPVVGKERVRKGREMAWIRVEKYVQGDNEVRFLLDLCQHCHHAPCESVCPVHATYHNGEGLNVMIYNRCVGTRYCSNNCTYKVRRFNWFDYVPDPPLPLQLNPDVTVRERGMMEKCTFCIQRIQRAKEQAKNEGRPVRDGEVVPACAQTCPARAITFGNLTDPKSRVAQLWNDPRGYRLLGELGTRPSIVYLKKVIRPKEV
jgi:molybdopterin-containing oxidoreductase family iron-sulfur binding subunit